MTVAVAFAAMQAENFAQQWEFVLSHFRVDALYSVGGPPPQSKCLCTAEEIADASEIPAELEIVLLAPPNGANLQGEIALSDFNHPENVVYWLGSDSRHIEAELFLTRPPDHKVYIPTDTIDQMYSSTAYAVTAWDRRCKG